MLFEAIYIEEDLMEEVLVQNILSKYKELPHITCKHFGEIFNPHQQNFRISKNAPSLILAKKHHQRVLPTPKGYGIGSENNYYFSHMFNCIYDCRYCFLQGMYSSGHYVVFVNQNDFMEDMKCILDQHPNEDVYFFSGYDCDSLALESVTGFVKNILPFFEKHPRAYLELRTKSAAIQPLLQSSPLPNVIAATTLSPESIIKEVEHRTPSLKQRLNSLEKLSKQGWNIGFRFDPLIAHPNLEKEYSQLIDKAFSSVVLDRIHSVTLGPFRLPKNVYKRMVKLYPDEPLFFENLIDRGKIISYKPELEDKYLSFVYETLKKHLPDNRIFPIPLEQEALTS